MAGVLKPSPGALRIIDDLEEGLAIVVNGNTAPKNIAAGQYLFIKNHSTLTTGGYHATAAISSGGTISSSNVAADADGIANSINSKLGGFIVEKYSSTLDNTNAENTYSTNITFTNYANVGIVVGNYARSTASDALVKWTLNKDGTLTLTKANASWGSSNAFTITVIHD